MRKIAVSYAGGIVADVCQMQPQFKIYSFKGDYMSGIQVVSAANNSENDIYNFLKNKKVKVLICDSIAPLFAQMLETRLHIEVYGGVSGDADSAAVGYVAGTLDFEPNMHSTEIEHHHSVSGHGHEHSVD